MGMGICRIRIEVREKSLMHQTIRFWGQMKVDIYLQAGHAYPSSLVITAETIENGFVSLGL